jgi:protein-tyrosine phosphatase
VTSFNPFFTIRPGPPTLAAVLPELLVGEYPNIADVAWLRDAHGVTAVVSLQDEADLASKNLRLRDLEAIYRAERVTFERFPVADGDVEALALALPAIVERLALLLDGGARVYIHCNAGYNRAPTAAIAYLHARRGLGLPEAVAAVKGCRPCVPYVRALEAWRRGTP